MGDVTKISWTDSTLNPWIGCQRVSPGCEQCYAQVLDKRVGGGVDPSDGVKKLRWGPSAPRIRTSAALWKKPLLWNRRAEATGKRHLVFCSSMADVFEDRPELVPWRADLFDLIAETPALTWQILTKRPENIARLWPALAMRPDPAEWPNIWLGTTVEDQQRANDRIPLLLKVPAAVRFLSCEPLLEAVRLDDLGGPGGVVFKPLAGLKWSPATEGQKPGLWPTSTAKIDWVIVGGESGPKARPFHLNWARAIVKQCRAAGVPCFVKQLGAHVACDCCGGRATCVGAYEGAEVEEPACDSCCGHGCEDGHCSPLEDRAGADPAEWPADLRVREFPAP